MANPHKGEVALAAAGKTYTLVYDNNAWCELEELTGRGFADVLFEMESWTPRIVDGKPAEETEDEMKARVRHMRLSVIRSVLWAGLQHKHKGMSVEMAGDIITDAGGLGPVMEQIGKAVSASSAKGEGAEEQGERPQ